MIPSLDSLGEIRTVAIETQAVLSYGGFFSAIQLTSIRLFRKCSQIIRNSLVCSCLPIFPMGFFVIDILYQFAVPRCQLLVLAFQFFKISLQRVAFTTWEIKVHNIQLANAAQTSTMNA